MQILSEWKSFGGRQLVVKHLSAATSTEMTFSIFLPPAAEASPCPALFFLAGLTCTWENATTKAGFQKLASELGLIVICPDTSPRGEDVANDTAYDLGQGAGFYVNAIQAPWKPHFRMEDYIADELYALVTAAYPIDAERIGITGHSMGGHGALTLAYKYPEKFKSVSAFSPIVAPTSVPWGKKAFLNYLGDDQSLWVDHDATLLAGHKKLPTHILIDQGDADTFLDEQLKTHLFEQACRAIGQEADIRMQPGYDHSYYFIASFMDEHLRHHIKHLTA